VCFIVSMLIATLYPSGDKDLICNWYGLRDMADEMTWNGVKGFGV
jgi:carboxypeptidase C (cathepsin A)